MTQSGTGTGGEGETVGQEACSLCGGSGEVVNRPTRVIGATGYEVDEQLKPCPVCRVCVLPDG